MPATWTRGQLWDKIVEQAQKNPKYYDMLLSDPRGLMQKQLGAAIPDSVNIQVLQESPDTYYVVLPYFVREGAELSDGDLEKVAGGKGDALGGLGGLGGISGQLQGMAGDVRDGAAAIQAGADALRGGHGSISGGGHATPSSAQCSASGSAVGTTIVDISL
jgi:hypothetical protein